MWGKAKPVVEVNKIDQYKQRAENALSIFRKTYQDLIAINKEVSVTVDEKQVQIDALKHEQATLDILFADNKKVAVKIAKIIGEEIEDA